MIKVKTITTENEITVKTMSGARGEQGPIGATGPAGETPVKGTDYWTETDIAEIETYCKNYIDENITNAIGEEY